MASFYVNKTAMMSLEKTLKDLHILYKGELNMAVYSHTVLPWIHVQFFTHHFFQRYNEPSLESAC